MCLFSTTNRSLTSITRALAIAVLLTNSLAWSTVSSLIAVGISSSGMPVFRCLMAQQRAWWITAMQTSCSKNRVCPRPRTTSGIRLWSGAQPVTTSEGHSWVSSKWPLAVASLQLAIRRAEAPGLNLQGKYIINCIHGYFCNLPSKLPWYRWGHLHVSQNLDRLDWICLTMTHPSEHISHPTHLNVSQSCLHSQITQSLLYCPGLRASWSWQIPSDQGWFKWWIVYNIWLFISDRIIPLLVGIPLCKSHELSQRGSAV